MEKKDAVAKKIAELIGQCPEDEKLSMYINNANFAQKMGSVIEKTATDLFAKAIMETNAEKQQELYSRSYALVTDAVIWDEVSMNLSEKVEEIEASEEI